MCRWCAACCVRSAFRQLKAPWFLYSCHVRPCHRHHRRTGRRARTWTRRAVLRDRDHRCGGRRLTRACKPLVANDVIFCEGGGGGGRGDCARHRPISCASQGESRCQSTRRLTRLSITPSLLSRGMHPSALTASLPADEVDKLRRRATDGDPDAQFRLGQVRLGWLWWLCGCGDGCGWLWGLWWW